VSAGQVSKPAQPKQSGPPTFEGVGLPDYFRKAVEEELTQDEKLVWLGQPSQNPEVHPPKTVFTVIGIVILCVAVALPLLVRGMPIFFPVALCFFGFLFLIAPRLINPVHAYQACYVITNRRAILFERGVPGLHPGATSLLAPRCRSYHPHELLALECRKNPRVPGSGDLIFEYIFSLGGVNTGFPGSQGTIQTSGVPQRIPRGFFYLDRVEEVEQLLRATLLDNLERKMDQDTTPVPTRQPLREEPSVPRSAAPVGGPAMEDCQVPADLRDKVRAELNSNEQLVWVGQPDLTLVFRRSLGYLIGGGIMVLFGLLLFVAGFLAKAAPPAAVGKGAAQVKTLPPPPVMTTGLPSIVFVIGAVCLVVPFYRWKMAQGTWYALTNRRALVNKKGLFGPTRESYSPAEVAAMRRSDSWIYKGGGDLIFRSVTVVTRSYNTRGRSSTSVRTTHYGFLALANVKPVEKLVRETLIDRFVDRLTQANAF
jgi:hypothetical protein